MQIETFTLGPFATNCYVVTHSSGGDDACWVIDCGFDPAPLLDYLKQNDLTPELAILTHAHADHIAGLPLLKKAYPDVPVLVHEAEAAFLSDPHQNLSAFLGQAVTVNEPDRMLKHGDTFDLADLTFEVHHTPGHSPGGITLYNSEVETAFVGDTLFRGTVGRTDFPHSDPDTLQQAIVEQLFTLPGNTRILPGHMAETTIQHERQTNPYVSQLASA